MKTIAGILICLFVAWAVFVKVQEGSRVPVARQIIMKKMVELKSTPFDKLAEKTGAGLQQEQINTGGATYYLSYSARKASADMISISGKVGCITLLPFTDLRIGPSFELRVTNDTSYSEAPAEGLTQQQR